MPDDSQARLAHLVAFATVGAVTTAQQVAGAILASIPDADPELVAEESTALVAVVTARALGPESQAAAVLAEFPLTFRDYLAGGRMLEGEPAPGPEVYERIARKLSFYQTHFPAGRMPGPRALKDKMELWMGRVSPPGLPESPADRLEKLDLVALVTTHIRLVKAYREQGDG